MLTKEQILSADDLRREQVNVPEWGGSVFVRTLTGTDRDAFEQSIIQNSERMDLANVRARMAVLCVVDEKGERLFADSDAQALGAKSSLALGRIFTVAQKLNGMTDADVEDLAKNSGGGPSAASTSG